MIVIPEVDAELERYYNDPDVVLNVSQAAVITSMPRLQDVQAHLTAFIDSLREGLLQLWAMPHAQAVKRFGQLGLNKKNNGIRAGALWGMVPVANQESKGLARVQNRAALRAIVDSGLLPEAECGTTKFKGSDGVARFLARQPQAAQRHFFGALLQPGCDLDTILRLGQGCRLGLMELRQQLGRASSAEDALRVIADEAAANLAVGVASSGRQEGRVYAPIWFASYLAAQGVWLLPLSFSERLLQSYPAWARPLQMWLAFPKPLHPMCECLMRDFLAGARQADANVISVALAMAASSDIWRAGGLRAGPLIGYKRHVQMSGRSAHQRSWAANRLWDAQIHHFGEAVNQHPDSHAFVLGKRLVSKGTRPFNWIHTPNPKSMKRFNRFFDEQPQRFPDWLIRWAEHLEELLPLFRVGSLREKINSLDLWLLYLTSQRNPPTTFAEVSRQLHVHSRTADAFQCFRKFLLGNYPDSASRHVTYAMATLRQAWALSAQLQGFDAELSNPFEAGDSPFEQQARNSRTTRSALDARVLEIIARENLKDEMAFARTVGDKHRLCWREVRHPKTGALVKVFFPAAPVVVHAILHSGMRGMQAAWLDSGEGDEFAIDFETMRRVPNPSPSARKGRNEGFFRLCEILGDTREHVLGMYINSGKSGAHEVPWIHPDLVKPIRELIEFQLFWFPIAKPVPIDRDPGFESRFKPDRGDAFPLMRDPANGLGHPISRERIRSYWIALLEHCQPIVDEELGYHYPLLLLTGTPQFDIHSLRVSIITTLLDHGVPISVVQMLVGHKSPIMTWYYHDVTNYKVHSALQLALEQRKARYKDPHGMSAEAEAELADQHVTFRDETDYQGIEFLRQQRSVGGFIDVFAHGICPGGACEKGGQRILNGKYKPVWKPRACSGCRFRVTGPAFLNGLVQRANSLLWEIKASMLQEAEVHAQIEAEEDAGRAVTHLRSAARSEQERRDFLFNEWCLEVRTIDRSLDILKSEANSAATGGAVALLRNHDLQEVTVRFREVHQFELAQRVTHDARLVDGLIDLPPGVELYRDSVLHRIAHANDIDDYFYSLPLQTAKRALTLFGEILIAHTAGGDSLDGLIEGSLLIRDMPGLKDALETGFDEAGMLDPAVLTPA